MRLLSVMTIHPVPAPVHGSLGTFYAEEEKLSQTIDYDVASSLVTVTRGESSVSFPRETAMWMRVAPKDERPARQTGSSK